jgi:hypothetical protein
VTQIARPFLRGRRPKRKPVQSLVASAGDGVGRLPATCFRAPHQLASLSEAGVPVVGGQVDFEKDEGNLGTRSSHGGGRQSVGPNRMISSLGHEAGELSAVSRVLGDLERRSGSFGNRLAKSRVTLIRRNSVRVREKLTSLLVATRIELDKRRDPISNGLSLGHGAGRLVPRFARVLGGSPHQSS